ncbi:MAG: hypothetical protein PUH25_07050, partial [Spirochaetales bacterium]|nr:hypothetical protein [Spirochaetales bacterium]
MYYKTTVDGEDKVCEALREYVAKSYDTGKADGINIGKADGIAEGTVRTLLKLVNSGNITLDYAIANSGLSKDKFNSIADNLGYKL